MTEEPTEFTHTEGQMTGEGPYHATPTTAAGKRMDHAWASPFARDEWREIILAIEAEARAPLDVERLAEALNLTGHYPLPVNEHIHKWAEDIAREYAKDPHP